MAKRIQKELADINKIAPGGCTVELVNDSINHWIVNLPGPAGSPYEGKMLRLAVDLPANYPFSKPEISFSPSIYHPNVDSSDGKFCLGEVKPNTMIHTIVSNVIDILKTPNVADPLNAEAAALYSSDVKAYNAKANASAK